MAAADETPDETPDEERTGGPAREEDRHEDSAPRPITSPQALKALAHPVRFALLNTLHSLGAARAADLATELGQPANSISFHLRQLARYGFIEEAPERARDRRDRWWKPASEHGFSFNPEKLSSTPAGKAVVDESLRMAQQRYAAALDRFFHLATHPDEAPDGTDIANLDGALRLTLEESEQFGRELSALYDRWARHGRERVSADDTEGRRPYLAVGVLVPWSSADEAAALRSPP